MEETHYRLLDHTSDMGFDVWGATPARLFENAARALFSEITDLRAVGRTVARSLRLAGGDRAELLHDWLAELLYLFEVEGLVLSGFRVSSLSGDGLQAAVEGEPFEPGRHPVHSAVKAVTRHQLSVVREDDGRWRARVIFDV